jgi:hypothetical protein
VPRAERLHGGCLCGAVRYRVGGELRPVIACHCGQCRKTSGHFVAATAADDASLDIDDPSGALKWYRSSSFAQRGFCGQCGSNLFWKRDGGSATSIMAGSLDGDTALRLEAHIYTADKGDYYGLDDDIPCFPAGR